MTPTLVTPLLTVLVALQLTGGEGRIKNFQKGKMLAHICSIWGPTSKSAACRCPFCRQNHGYLPIFTRK